MDPIIVPGIDNLKELFTLGITVTTAVSLIGISEAPKLKNGWPNA